MDINGFQLIAIIYIYIDFSGLRFELMSIELMHLVPSDLNGLQLYNSN